MRGLRVARIAGVDIVLDGSWIVIALLVTLSLFAEFTVSDDGGSSAALRWTLALLGSALFFGSLLAHELSHAMVARQRGISVRRIRLFIFGGVAEIEKEATRPEDELAITIAGPLTSVALGGLFYLASSLGPDLQGAPGRLLPLLGFVNLALGLFNLVPGFPLDGGRILRSITWKVTGSYSRATRIAAGAGQVVALLLASAGAWLLLVRGNAAGVWYLAIGWFLFQAARAAASFGLARDSVAGHPAGALMTPVTMSVDADATLQSVYEDHLDHGARPTVPVVVDGRVAGFLDVEDIKGYPRPQRDRLTAGQAMVRLRPETVVAAEDDMGDVLDRMAGSNETMAVVAEGRVVGVLISEEVARWVEEREDHRSRPPTGEPAPG